MTLTTRDITTIAILPCRGGHCPKEQTSRHRFSRFVDRVGYDGKTTDVDMLYACDGCGHERAWGTIDPSIFYSKFTN
jgi:hypothetical protein